MLAMSTFVSPQIFLISLLAGWLNQEQQKVLEYWCLLRLLLSASCISSCEDGTHAQFGASRSPVTLESNVTYCIQSLPIMSATVNDASTWSQVCEVTEIDYGSLPQNVALRVKRSGGGLHV